MTKSSERALLGIVVGAGFLYPLVQGSAHERFWLGFLDGALVVSLIALAAFSVVRLRQDRRSVPGWAAAALVVASMVGVRWLSWA